MSELRQNIATKEWVIIAPERATRPEDFARTHGNGLKQVESIDSCPFCPGNEHLCPPTINAIYDRDGSWLVRVVSNKYPALAREGELDYSESRTNRRMNGVGMHDVIIDTPDHHRTTALLDEGQVENILKIYKSHYLYAVSDPRIELVTVFKNHGPTAGTSLEHPHSQVIATPVVPAQVRQRMALGQRYYDDHRSCVFCSMLSDEVRSGDRVVVESEHFAAFVLYAALSPFHMWVLPKRHQSAFPELTHAEIADLARVLREVLGKIHFGLDNPDYNYVIRSMPGIPHTVPTFHWYMSIVPRVSTSAGFELGSGMFINTVLPETAAEFLRRVVLAD